jgi:hypothetical protein
MEKIYDHLESVMNKNVVRSLIREYACPEPTPRDKQNKKNLMREIKIQRYLGASYLGREPPRKVSFSQYFFTYRFCVSCNMECTYHLCRYCHLCDRTYHMSYNSNGNDDHLWNMKTGCGYEGREKPYDTIIIKIPNFKYLDEYKGKTLYSQISMCNKCHDNNPYLHDIYTFRQY